MKPDDKGNWAIQADYLTHKAAKGEEEPMEPDYSDKNWVDLSL